MYCLQLFLKTSISSLAVQCLLLLSQMPPESVGDKADVERLYDAVDVLLYLQVKVQATHYILH